MSANVVYLLLYVDDMLLVGPNVKVINSVKQLLSSEFDMKELGARAASVPLGGHYKLFAYQCPITEQEKEYMSGVPYSSAIGSITYLMVSIRPDLARAVSVLSKFTFNPRRSHWDAMEWLMRYLKFTTNEGLLFKGSQEGVELLGYTDADYAGDQDKRKSISTYAFIVYGNCPLHFGWDIGASANSPHHDQSAKIEVEDRTHNVGDTSRFGRVYHQSHHVISPYTDPCKKKVKFNLNRPIDASKERAFDEWYRVAPKEATVCTSYMTVGKKCFTELLTSEGWLNSDHIDTILYFIRKRRFDNEKMFTNTCAILDVLFWSSIKGRYPIWRASRSTYSCDATLCSMCVGSHPNLACRGGYVIMCTSLSTMEARIGWQHVWT
ncbi:uncharacterized protein LOC132799611 [Ziziphus jujuba]|uniref:Uncharacterized protein LOC132799611 n=1 Tax=Ziziphus jujuba TaxID=326968 RepID=A0ABM3ZTS5_ZIZJJ|nr:uncharacterized protein LOC132799611 [Ziziphus jujuba]